MANGSTGLLAWLSGTRDVSNDDDYLDGFHAGLKQAKLDACRVGELLPNGFYEQRVGT